MSMGEAADASALSAQSFADRHAIDGAGDSVPDAAGRGEERPSAEGRYPIVLRAFGVLCVIGGAASTPVLLAIYLRAILGFFTAGTADERSAAIVAIIIVLSVSTLAISALFLVLGVRLLRSLHRATATIASLMVAFELVSMVCSVMLEGIGAHLVPNLVALGLLVALASYADPTLRDERERRRSLRLREIREQAEAGMLGRDASGRGYISLNFFNLFWVFVIGCVVGVAVESIYHVLIYDPGDFQNRSSLLYGQFSPIYGAGALFMTVALNRFHRASPVVIFVVSALIGGAFEYVMSWVLQLAFGISAWDYTGTFLSIGGRTSAVFMAMWGLLGLAWIKLLLPQLLRLVNLIPWNWRYMLTTVCAALLFADAAITLVSLDCWYERLSGNYGDTAIERFCAEHYDNDFMAEYFRSMAIDPTKAMRIH